MEAGRLVGLRGVRWEGLRMAGRGLSSSGTGSDLGYNCFPFSGNGVQGTRGSSRKASEETTAEVLARPEGQGGEGWRWRGTVRPNPGPAKGSDAPWEERKESGGGKRLQFRDYGSLLCPQCTGQS